jgi:hypothetical protein
MRTFSYIMVVALALTLVDAMLSISLLEPQAESERIVTKVE